MALTTTTTTAAIALNDKVISVTSATGFAAGSLVLVDVELMQVTKEYVSGLQIPVLRGQDGTQQIAHVVGTNATVGTGTDFATPIPGGIAPITYPQQRGRDVRYYAAAGAITNPVGGRDMLAIIIGAAKAMTLTSPTKDMDGSVLTIGGGTAAAHTVTYTTTGFGGVGATADVMTFSATQAQAFQCIAINGVWNLLGPLATATASVSGPSLA
jgi:hypothetical protein